jgi:hypothetical protein
MICLKVEFRGLECTARVQFPSPTTLEIWSEDMGIAPEPARFELRDGEWVLLSIMGYVSDFIAIILRTVTSDSYYYRGVKLSDWASRWPTAVTDAFTLGDGTAHTSYSIGGFKCMELQPKPKLLVRKPSGDSSWTLLRQGVQRFGEMDKIMPADGHSSMSILSAEDMDPVNLLNNLHAHVPMHCEAEFPDLRRIFSKNDATEWSQRDVCLLAIFFRFDGYAYGGRIYLCHWPTVPENPFEMVSPISIPTYTFVAARSLRPRPEPLSR